LANKGERVANNVILRDYLPEGICYKTGSTFVLDPMFREIGEPEVSGDCSPGGQLLTWSNDYNNALTFPGITSGSLIGNSEDIYIRYVGIVQASVPLGVSLLNGAKVNTTDAQDNYRDKEDSQEIAVPYPDLYVQMDSPLIAEGASVFDYTLSYGNASRMCAENPYLLLTVPNVQQGEHAAVKVKALTVDKNEERYSYPCPYLDTPPSFDWDDPLTGGRVSGVQTNACYFAIKVPESAFCSAQGQRNLVLTVQATDPITNNKLSAGTEMTANAQITNLKGEGNPADNTVSASTKVPTIDLWIEMDGDPAGLTPGILPNQLITYTMRFGNQGTEESCSNKVQFTADEHVEIDSFDFTSLSLTDNDGTPIAFKDPS
jgi:hypothetical protein